MSEDRVRVGVVKGAVGLQGAVKVEPLTDFTGRFTSGAAMELGGQPRRIEWIRRTPGKPALVVKISGIDDRISAEQQRGRYLEVPQSSVPELAQGAYYHYQLVGLAVSTQSGRQLGELAEVLERPANDVWVVRSDAHERLVPATRDAVLEVDLQTRRVVVADWLFDVEEAG